ncbi:MAG: VWA domain-containing protein [Spirochaetales bacterium]|nr:VWA domain-containing protein [Spirochaetales bacterium]
MTLMTPLWLLMLLGLPLFILTGNPFGKKRTDGIPYPAAGKAILKQGIKVKLIFLPKLFGMLAFILLVIALARPVGELVETEKKTEGIALQMVVDKSGSMGALTNFDGKEINRLEIVKQVMKDFIFGNSEDLKGRSEDLIGLISFARYADTLFPLSLSHDPLEGFITSLNLVDREEEDGTSIGDALALACARLGSPNLETGREGSYRVKNRVVILITDGASNAGETSPGEAAELAASLGIKVYCIGFGGDAWVRRAGLFGQQKIPVGSNIDIETLRGISDITGGKFWLAEDGDSIREIYSQINELEKTEVQAVEYKNYREHYKLFVIISLISLALSIILDHTIFRRSP